MLKEGDKIVGNSARSVSINNNRNTDTTGTGINKEFNCDSSRYTSNFLVAFGKLVLGTSSSAVNNLIIKPIVSPIITPIVNSCAVMSLKPSSSQHQLARRKHGVCLGTLWLGLEYQPNKSSDNSAKSFSTGNHSKKIVTTLELCLLVGVHMETYECVQSYLKGDFPLHIWKIVGASAWNPKMVTSDSSNTNNHSTATETSFRLVTELGSHIQCTASTNICRDLWLEALYSGLDRSLLFEIDSTSSDPNNRAASTSTKQQPPEKKSPQIEKSTRRRLIPPMPQKLRFRKRTTKYCVSCGNVDSEYKAIISNVTPLRQYDKENRQNLCSECCVAQGLLNHLHFMSEMMATAHHERQALMQVRQMCKTYMVNAIERCENIRKRQEQFKDKKKQSNDDKCANNIGIQKSPASKLELEREEVAQTWNGVTLNIDAQKSIFNLVSYDPEYKSHQRISPILDYYSAQLLNHHFDVPDFLEQLDAAVGELKHSNDLQQLKKEALRVSGDITTAMKMLKESAFPPNNAGSSSNTVNESPTNSKSSFYYYRNLSSSEQSSTLSGALCAQDDMFPCILEFLLDLCEDGELSSVGFFWPQLCHLHLQMLPPTNFAELQRVECLEDFLISVSTKYSIHLALELIWSHTADLEESLLSCTLGSSGSITHGGGGFGKDGRKSAGGDSKNQGMYSSPYNNAAQGGNDKILNTSTANCRNRRFAVLRFVCELESLLFDLDNGWGGGSVSLRRMLMPTNHQNVLLADMFTRIQEFRWKLPPHGRLSRSARHSAIEREQKKREKFAAVSTTASKIGQQKQTAAALATATCDLKNISISNSIPNQDEVEQAAVHEALRIARNAEYFSSHLNFTRRICDIAGKLHFLDVTDREKALSEELELLNSSGAMGGDPLNRIWDHHIRIVGIPRNEGHVFRSKERTPVLLLMEVFDDTVEDEIEDDGPVNGKRKEEIKIFEPTKTEGMGDICNGSEMQQQSLQSLPSLKESNIQIEGKANITEETNVEEMDKLSTNESDIGAEPTKHGIPARANGERKEHMSPGRSKLLKVDIQSLADLPGNNDIASPVNMDVGKVEKMLTSVVVKQLDLPDLTIKTNNSKGVTIKENKHGNGPPRSSIGPLKSISNKECGDSKDIRREVLQTIMMKGQQMGKNSIAAGTTEAVQRSLQELHHRSAVALLFSDDQDKSDGQIDILDESKNSGSADMDASISSKAKLISLGLESQEGSKASDREESKQIEQAEEDDTMESLRLVLLQNQAVQGQLSKAASFLTRASFINNDKESNNNSDIPAIDAGDIDPRLAGCGRLTPAVFQALTLWKAGMVSNGELLELVKKDLEHGRQTTSESIEKLKEDSAFWGRFAFGERWAEKKARISLSSPHGKFAGYDLIGVIVKANDDLRQEAFVMQLIELCKETFRVANLELWVQPYRILATGRTTGILELAQNAMSFDALKKRPGYGKGGLREHLHKMTEFSANPGDAFKSAQRNFVSSSAAYSLMSYFFMFKDRHNGNILLDTVGHVIHIDFGFVFGDAPGGSFSLEMSTPFKFTEEMLDVMGGLRSPLFSEFITLFCCGFLAIQAQYESFLTLVEISSRESTFKCFEGRDSAEVVAKMKERFQPDLTTEQTVAYALDLIKQATSSYGTKQYDFFQYMSQGIAS